MAPPSAAGQVTRTSTAPSSPPITLKYRVIQSPSAPYRATLVFLPGLLSNWSGSKALFLESQATALGLDYLSLHYQGHGYEINEPSSGQVQEIRSLEEWILDVEAVLDAHLVNKERTDKSHFILVGSSIGAWIGLWVALRRPEMVKGLILIAPAVDASKRWSKSDNTHGNEDKYVNISSNYVEDGGIMLQRAFMDDANAHWLLVEPKSNGRKLLDASFASRLRDCPVQILAGEKDEVIAVSEVERLAAAVPGSKLVVAEGGDHRLSREEDLNKLKEMLEEVIILY